MPGKLSTDFGIKDKPMLGFVLTAFFSFKVKSLKFDFRLLTLLFILGGKKALEPQHFFRPSSRGSAQFFFDPLKSKLKSSEFSVFYILYFMEYSVEKVHTPG